ncbi:MAG: type II toxin-antitoxin system RelE/ParE family toxin [Polyangiaceae bacterium]
MKVVLASRARQQAAAAAQWWRRNRRAAPTMFTDELRSLVSELRRGSELGREHDVALGIRRVLLRRSGYHVYYVSEADAVVILAVWHTARGREPPLTR